MTKSGVRVTKDDVASTVEAIKAMSTRRVYVGVPGETSERGEDINNVALAFIHDRGSPAANIPARPFLQPGINAKRDEISARLAAALKPNKLSVAALNVALEQAGLIAQTSVKKVIVSQDGFTPLKAATLSARKRANFQGTKALIWTGKLLNSITYVVRDA